MKEDLRYAIGAIRRNPLLALASILTLALGIGLNAGVFTILDGIMFRARVEKDPASFVHLSPTYFGAALSAEAPWAVSTRDYEAIASQSRTLASVAAWSTTGLIMDGTGDPLLSLYVTCNFFDVYGLREMKAGRRFSGGECQSPGFPPTAIISEELWRDRFAADPDIVGKTVRFNSTLFAIVGIIPTGFSGRIRGPGIWLPWTAQAALSSAHNLFQDEKTRWLTVEGRLARGGSRTEARAELQLIATRLDRQEPGRHTTMVLTNGSFGEEPALRGNLFWMGPLVMGALTLILLLACTNVAILQLSRAVSRQREMGIRLALGAGRWRLTRMLLMETLVLTTLAGAASLAVAYEAPAAFAKMLSSTSTPVYSFAPDSTVLIYLFVTLILATVFTGLSPAAESLRVSLAVAMKTGDAGSGVTRSSGLRHNLLIATQVSVCLVLLSTAGMFLRAQQRMATADPGFEAKRVLLLQRRFGGAASTDARRVLQTIPGVRLIALGSPFSSGEIGDDQAIIRLPGAGGEVDNRAVVSSVSSEFFAVLNTPIVRGHIFTEDSEVVVSQALARSFWLSEDPVGHRLILPDGANLVVAGVAGDLSTEHAGSPDPPHIYRRQAPQPEARHLLVSFTGTAEPVETAIRESLKKAAIDSFAPPRTLRSIIDDNAGRLNSVVTMVGVLAFTGLALAMLGIYGVIAFSANRRSRELAIRVALGATGNSVIGTVLGAGLRPVLWGLGSGLMMAWAAAVATQIVLRQTPIPLVATDPAIYTVVSISLTAIAVGAMLGPALRAASTDPMRVLRQD